MLLALKERILAIMNEQRAMIVCSRVLHMNVWLFAADGLETERRSPFNGTPAMRLLSKLLKYTLLRIFTQLQKNRHLCDFVRGKCQAEIGKYDT